MIRFHSLTDTLAYQLKGLYDAEHKILKAIPHCYRYTYSPRLQHELEHYCLTTNDKITKLERIFNYLMTEPAGLNSITMNSMVDELDQVTCFSIWRPRRDVLLVSSIQSIQHYKIAGYSSGKAIALELELDTVTDLLGEILAWEKQSDNALKLLASEEIHVKALTFG